MRASVIRNQRLGQPRAAVAMPEVPPPLKARAAPVRANGQDTFTAPLGFWRAAVAVSDYQRQVLANWSQWLSPLGLAPTKLWQDILQGWVIGPQVNINMGRSSDPSLEENIVNNVAGYGSQLGTILDYLEVLESEEQLSRKRLEKGDRAKVARLLTLIDQVNQAKARLKQRE